MQRYLQSSKGDVWKLCNSHVCNDAVCQNLNRLCWCLESSPRSVFLVRRRHHLLGQWVLARIKWRDFPMQVYKVLFRTPVQWAVGKWLGFPPCYDYERKLIRTKMTTLREEGGAVQVSWPSFIESRGQWPKNRMRLRKGSRKVRQQKDFSRNISKRTTAFAVKQPMWCSSRSNKYWNWTLAALTPLHILSFSQFPTSSGWIVRFVLC